MLPLQLMSLHEISKREERTMALCVKKLNSTCPWNDQTATTAASPSTSTPPSFARIYHDDTVFSTTVVAGLLRRLWRELNIVGPHEDHFPAGKRQFSTTALQFYVRVRLLLKCNNASELSDFSLSSFNRRKNGNSFFNERLRYGLQSKTTIQQRWLQLRKYWRHNARRRLRKTERKNSVQQSRVTSRTAEKSSSNVFPIKNPNKFSNSCNADNYNDNIVCLNGCQDSKELLRRHFRFLKFCFSSFQRQYQQQQCHYQYLQQIKLPTLQEWCRSFGEQKQQLPTRTTFYRSNKTTQGQSNIVTIESSEIATRSSYPPISSNIQNFFHLITMLLCGQLSNELYTHTTCRNSRRRTICDSMSPIFLARSKKRFPTKTFTRVSERTRPGVCMLQSITLVSHPRNRNCSPTLSKSKDETNRSIFNKNSMSLYTLPVMIEGVHLDAVCDTGAPCYLLPKSFLEEGKIKRRLEKCQTNYVSYSGDKIKILGVNSQSGINSTSFGSTDPDNIRQNYSYLRVGGAESVTTDGEGRRCSPYWCEVAYWEMTQRVGKRFPADTPVINIFSEKPYNTPGDHKDGMCLKDLIDKRTTPSPNNVQYTRQKIGLGITLSQESDGVWLFNRSTVPVFVHSPTLTESWYRVCRVEPGDCLRAFDKYRAQTLIHPGQLPGLQTGPIDKFSMRISFGKGWGCSYKRRDVTLCPCWLEVIFQPQR